MGGIGKNLRRLLPRGKRDVLRAECEALSSQLHRTELARHAAATALTKMEASRDWWRAQTEGKAQQGQRLLDLYDQLTLALAFLWGDARKNAFADRIEKSGPWVFEDLKASRLARKNLDAILGALDDLYDEEPERGAA